METPWNNGSRWKITFRSKIARKHALKKKIDLLPPTAVVVAAETSEREEKDKPNVPVDNSMPTDCRLP